MSLPTELPDGIYFDLSFEAYLALERMSAGGLTDIMEGPGAFWAGSWMNPDRKDEDTPARKLGRAYHCARLEPDEFASRYCRELVVEDFDSVLANGTEIGSYLGELGETKKKAGESVVDQAKRLQACLDAGARVETEVVEGDEPEEPPVIFPLKRHLWEEENADKEWLSPSQWQEVERDVERLRMNPEIADLLTGGAAEVTILWTEPETGIKCKIRPDYLKLNQIVHLKTWDMQGAGKPGNRAIADAFKFNGYNRTCWFYYMGLGRIVLDKIKVRTNEGKVHKGKLPPEIAPMVASWQAGEHEFQNWFLFVRRSGIPDIRAREVIYWSLPRGVKEQMIGAENTHKFTRVASVLARKAEHEVMNCLHAYVECLEIYGSDPWFPRDMIDTLEDDDFSSFWLDSEDAPR